MKQLLSVLSAVALFVAPALGQDSAFRLYLAEEGVDGNTPLRGITPRQGNPELGPTTSRLYVWGQVIGAETPQKYVLIGYNVVTTGDVQVVGHSTWNYTNILRRWSATNGGQLSGGSLRDVRLIVQGNPIGFFGVADDATAGDDEQYDRRTVSTVIGWIDVTGTSGDIFLQIGDIGIIRTNTLGNPNATWDDVYLGFGDENAGVMGNSYNVGSPIPEATIVPRDCDPCDMNCDGDINALDIEPFIGLLFDPNATPCAGCTGDTNGDGRVDALDIEPFLGCLFP